MIPILIFLSIPPLASGGGYVLWSKGEKLELNNQNLKYPPPQSASTYAIGILAFFGVYAAQTPLFKLIVGPDANGTPSQSQPFPKTHHQKQQLGLFDPPKDIQALVKRMGPPVLVRCFAASVAFFIAGFAQTKYAIKKRNNGR